MERQAKGEYPAFMRSLAFASLLVAVCVGVTRSTATGAVSFVVQSDDRIGSFRVKKDGTLHGATRAFGKPSSLRREQQGFYCVARWSEIGLRISFYNLGGRDPCAPQYGYFGQALITGKQWRTSKGLRIGEPVHRLHALYRNTRTRGPWAWLVTRYTSADDIGYYPGLEAKQLRGWVVAFRVNYTSGGV